MEFACRSRPTAAAGDADDGRRRISDPPRPHDHDADPALEPGYAALGRRREELLSQLHKLRARQDAILRELAETELAMRFCGAAGNRRLGPWPLDDCLAGVAAPGSRRGAPSSAAPWEEAPAPLLDRRADHAPCCCGSPGPVRAPPVYPQVERSPPPPPLPLPRSDAEQQRECSRWSGARADQVIGVVELYRSPSTPASAAQAMAPEVANANVTLTRSALAGEEVAPGHLRVVGKEGREGVQEDGHGVKPKVESRNQSSVQRMAAGCGMGDLVDETVKRICQGQENSAFNQQKRLDCSEPAPERTSSALKRKLTEATPPPANKKQKPLGRWSCVLCEVNTTCQRNLDEHFAGRMHQSNVAAAAQSSESDTESEEEEEPRWTCGLCDARCTSEVSLRMHLGGRRHAENVEAVEERKRALYCRVCDVQCNGEKMLASHLGGRRHQAMIGG
ncbi:hypothetical protein ACP4OV_023999 [Aristida adscensionis]